MQISEPQVGLIKGLYYFDDDPIRPVIASKLGCCQGTQTHLTCEPSSQISDPLLPHITGRQRAPRVKILYEKRTQTSRVQREQGTQTSESAVTPLQDAYAQTGLTPGNVWMNPYCLPMVVDWTEGPPRQITDHPKDVVMVVQTSSSNFTPTSFLSNRTDPVPDVSCLLRCHKNCLYVAKRCSPACPYLTTVHSVVRFQADRVWGHVIMQDSIPQPPGDTLAYAETGPHGLDMDAF